MDKVKNHSFPKEWGLELFHLVSTMNGRIGWQGLKQSEFTQNPNEPYLITGMNFKDGKIRWDEVYHIPKKRYEEAKNIQLKQYDVLITKDGTIGKVLFVDKIPYPHEASLNSHLLVFRPIGKKYIPKFLFYQLQSKSFLDYVEENKSGSTFFGITQKAIGKYPVFLPPNPEQKSISQSLSDINELIDSLENLIEKKKNIKQGMLQELLTGKRRSKGFSGEWKNISFNDAFYITAGGDLDKISFSESQDDRHPFPIYSNSLINSGLYGFSSKFQYEKESITITARGTVGKANARSHKYSAIGRVLILKPIQKLDCFFVAEYINNKIKFSIESTGVPQLTTPQISKYLIDLPELDEQLVISNILSDMDSEIQELKQNRDKYIMIKQGMMQKLLTGEIRLV